MLNRRFIPCHLLLNWNISAFSTCWNGLDQHKMDKLYRGSKNSDWRSWKNPNEYEIEGSEGGLSGVLKFSDQNFAFGKGILQEFFKKLIGIIKFMKIPNSFFFATNDKFLSSVQDQIYVSKSISWMKCLSRLDFFV